jgi:hypothetical protein
VLLAELDLRLKPVAGLIAALGLHTNETNSHEPHEPQSQSHRLHPRPAAVVWVAIGYVGGSTLAFGVSCVIAAVYVAGASKCGASTATRRAGPGARQHPGRHREDLGEWLQQVPAALRNAVRLRIEGERVALPGPGVTPYLVGLLVLLGMLGTFLGMVVTLNGAVLALESTTDLHTIRSALAAPVKGLGVAFGTSVAGVATSAMLGLISALCRRDRLQVGQLLDSKIAGALRDFSFAHQRQETFKALQAQAQALPELVGKLDAMMSQMAEQNRQLGEQLLAGQQRFHEESQGRCTPISRSRSTSRSRPASGTARRSAAAAIQPIVTATMAASRAETREPARQAVRHRRNPTRRRGPAVRANRRPRRRHLDAGPDPPRTGHRHPAASNCKPRSPRLRRHLRTTLAALLASVEATQPGCRPTPRNSSPP